MASYGDKNSGSVIRKHRFKPSSYNLPGMGPGERNVALFDSFNMQGIDLSPGIYFSNQSSCPYGDDS